MSAQDHLGRQWQQPELSFPVHRGITRKPQKGRWLGMHWSADIKVARRFAGPLPFTFTYNKETKEVLIIEGVRQNWTPNPVKVIDYNFDFLSSLKLENPLLANAFIIKNIPYYWKKGKIEKWK